MTARRHRRGGGECEATVSLYLRAQAARTDEQNRLHLVEAKTETQTQTVVSKHGGMTDETGIMD